MRRFGLKKSLAFLIIFLCVGYLAYDNYFKLPFGLFQHSPGSKEDGNQADFDRFTVLVLGLDGRKGVNDRADTIMLVSVDGKTERGQILSIPRDTRVKVKGAWDKVNAAYAYGGVDLTKKTLTDFLGVTADRFVVVDFASVVKIADLVGGIDVDVPLPMHVPLEGIDLQPGPQHLDGEQVLAYSRFRGTIEGDIGRIQRQQQVLKLLAEKVLSFDNVTRMPKVLGLIKEEIHTDLTVKEMVALARLAPEALEQGIDMKVLPGKNKKIDGIWYWEPDLSDS